MLIDRRLSDHVIPFAGSEELSGLEARPMIRSLAVETVAKRNPIELDSITSGSDEWVWVSQRVRDRDGLQ